MGAPGEQVTGLEIPPVGDAWSVPRTLVRRLDNRAYQQLAELFLLVKEK